MGGFRVADMSRACIWSDRLLLHTLQFLSQRPRPAEPFAARHGQRSKGTVREGKRERVAGRGRLAVSHVFRSRCFPRLPSRGKRPTSRPIGHWLRSMYILRTVAVYVVLQYRARGVRRESVVWWGWRAAGSRGKKNLQATSDGGLAVRRGMSKIGFLLSVPEIQRESSQGLFLVCLAAAGVWVHFVGALNCL